ncbi:hypothetical protein [Nocardiopsis rhodophaea]|uniref:hypothetical protein n=1 Tax=Nocardiopsis rhodophaea TaxID=280238 RepID=UPI0031DBE02C
MSLWWWPASLISVGAWTIAWWQGRTYMEHLAQLVEATIDLHITPLATILGRVVEGPFTPADGEAVTRALHKGY